MRPEYRTRLLAPELAPVSQLSGSFLKPKTPLDLQFAYFESALVVEYLVDKYGPAALGRILLDLADDVPINQALARHTEKIEQLDADFAGYARAKAEAFGPGVDWSELKLPAGADLAALAAWNQEHPKHYQGLARQAERLVEQKKWSEAKPVLAELATMYPAAAYPLLARVQRALNEAAEEQATLEKLAATASDASAAYARLLEIAVAAEDWPAVEQNARRLLAVNPLVPGPYRQLARAAEALGHFDEAIRAQQALLLLDSSDPSEIHYRLACLLVAKQNWPAARRHVLQSLEETPRYRAAQRLLLEIVDTDAKKTNAEGSP
jgi:tetratricopeptide (TPR) repeat protein